MTPGSGRASSSSTRSAAREANAGDPAKTPGVSSASSSRAVVLVDLLRVGIGPPSASWRWPAPRTSATRPGARTRGHRGRVARAAAACRAPGVPDRPRPMPGTAAARPGRSPRRVRIPRVPAGRRRGRARHRPAHTRRCRRRGHRPVAPPATARAAAYARTSARAAPAATGVGSISRPAAALRLAEARDRGRPRRRAAHRVASRAPPASRTGPAPPGAPNRSPGSWLWGPGLGRAWDRWTPPSSRQRSSGASGSPRSSPSTVSATSVWTVTRSRSMISTTTSNVGGALRSRTLFWVRRRRASSSPRVTVWMPPMRSDRVGLTIRLSRLLPCAVPMSWTPRSAMVRAAAASSSVPISSMTMTSGMWFSTASIITACWWAGVRTCIRRARPMPGCGMSPSPAISLEVSTTTTRLSTTSARTRAASRSMVVLPMPGRPMMSTDLPGLHQVLDDLDGAEHRATDAARQADDLAARGCGWPRCDGASARCPRGCRPRTTPMLVTTTCCRSSSAISRSSRTLSPPAPKRASGRRPRSITTSMTSEHVGQRPDRVADLGWQRLQQGRHVVGGLASVQLSHGSSMSSIVWDGRQRVVAGSSAGSATRTSVSFNQQ